VLRGKTDRLEELQPVGVQRGVQDEDVRLEALELATHLANRSCPVHIVSQQRESIDDLLGDGGLILGDQDAGAGWRHDRAS